MKFLLTKIQQALGITDLKQQILELQSSHNISIAEITELKSALSIQRALIAHDRANAVSDLAKANRRITNLQARVLKLRNDAQREQLITGTTIELTASGQIEGLSQSIKEILDRNLPLAKPFEVNKTYVAPILPADHPKVVEQKQRDQRYADKDGVPAYQHNGAQTHEAPDNFPAVKPLFAKLHDVEDGRHFTCTDFFKERLPWFAEGYVTLGSLTARVNRMGAEEGVTPRTHKTKARTLARSWPIRLLKRAARDVALDKGAIAPKEASEY